MPAVHPFEARARKVRRLLRRYPSVEPLFNRAGRMLWLWHLRRAVGRGGGLHFRTVIETDPCSIRLSLPADRLPLRDRSVKTKREGRVRGGGWDRAAMPLEPRPHKPSSAFEPPGIDVALDRRGRICLVSGHRALASALEHEVTLLSVEVVLRHRRWVRIANEVWAYAKLRGGTAYQPYLHPDLVDIPSDQGPERFELLRRELPVREGTLIDLGANSGYFCHLFEKLGFRCFAVERSEKEGYFLSSLRDASCLDFEIITGSLTKVKLPHQADVVLALNVLHHFLKTEASYHELEAFLHRLETRYLLFEAHLPDDPQMTDAERNMSPTGFVEWVRRTGGYGMARQLGVASDGRPIYLLASAQ